MIVLSRAYWDSLLYKFIDSSSTYMCLQCVRACSFSLALPLPPLLLHSACSVHHSRLASTLWSMNTVNKCPEHPWGQGAYGTGPRSHLWPPLWKKRRLTMNTQIQKGLVEPCGDCWLANAVGARLLVEVPSWTGVVWRPGGVQLAHESNGRWLESCGS